MYQELEVKWAEFNDLDPAGMVACSSGTAALHLALEALRLPPGSEVITSDFNMIAVPRAITLAGLTPMFVDCREDLLIDPEWALPGFPTIVTHVYGRRVLVEHLASPGRIIEDLAEAHGIKPHDTTDAACWSFYKNKIVAGEEGGAVWFRDPENNKRARSLRSLGFTDAHDFNHIPRGHNYRLANSLANKILTSLSLYKDNYGGRRASEATYDAVCPAEWKMPPRDAPWVYDLRVRGDYLPYTPPELQNKIVRTLREAGIEARHAFKPMSEQEEFKNCIKVGGGNATRLSHEVIYLPLLPEVSPQEAQRIFGIVRDCIFHGTPA